MDSTFSDHADTRLSMTIHQLPDGPTVNLLNVSLDFKFILVLIFTWLWITLCQIHKEIQRLTGKDAANRLQRFYTPARVEKFLELLQRDVKSDIASTLSAVRKSSDYDMNSKY